MYENLGGPDAVLEKMRDFCVSKGWTILENLTADLPIDGGAAVDGKRLSISKGDIIAHFRSANGKPIFKTSPSSNCYGIGLTCSTEYTSNPPSGFWFDQPNATKNTAQEVIGVGIPVKQDSNLRLYCNEITDPAEMLIFTLELSAGYYQHLAVGTTQKVGGWIGGTIYSGSRGSSKMFPGDWNMPTVENESSHLFGLAAVANTFLRIDVDAAPLRTPSVLWAGGGPDSGVSFTGKLLGMGLTDLNCLSKSWFPKVPHFAYLQSQTANDFGRDVNTLNCISVNLPLALYIQRDPDALKNYSQVGYVPGIYAISMRNVAPGQLYEISYPQSGNQHQVFPHIHRGGVFGYDGISIKQ